MPTSDSFEDFGAVSDDRRARVFTLELPGRLRVRVSDFGATLVSCEVPDDKSGFSDLVLGYDSVAGYLGPGNPYFGASVGRYANRIANGRFSLDGKNYELKTNNAPGGIPSHLHGGEHGFSRAIWYAEPDADGRSITFTHRSICGDEGYPGNVEVCVTYSITDDGELVWEATATTDAATVINLISHSYWNLSGDPTTPITDHELTLFADHYLPTTAGQIPTGEVAEVRGTPMDFTAAHRIGERIDEPFEALEIARGYDHCWVLSGDRKDEMAKAARLKDPKSRRVLEVYTNQPAVQFYTANWVTEEHFMGTNEPGKNGKIYSKHSGCCLETENFPDAPNHPDFPSAVLRPGQTYHHRLIHRFSQD